MLGSAFVVLLLAAPAAAQEPTPPPAADLPASGEAACLVTGYLAGSGAEQAELVEVLPGEPVQQLSGQPLAPEQTWWIPAGELPAPALDTTGPVAAAQATITLAGRSFPVAEYAPEEPAPRYVPSLGMPHFGPVVRTMGLTLSDDDCAVSVVLMADRPVWSSLAGGSAWQ